MKNNIIVFGGVHIDILADYSKKDKIRVDRVGELHYSIGGTAYNIAYHLAEKKNKIYLYSVLNRNSYSTLWIIRETKNTLIKTLFQIDHSTFTENGFVAIRQDGNLERAVTSSYLSKAELEPKLLEKYCKNKDIAVIDCNFESHQIATIMKYCKKHDLLVVIAATSDSKVKRISPILKNYVVDVVTMNELEACSFFCIKKIEDLTVAMIPFNLSNLVITLGAKGHVIYSDGKITYFEAPHISEIVSTSGSGDALSAAIVSSISENNGVINWDDCNKKICEFVGEAITQHGTYLKPTRKGVPYKLVVTWGIIFFICIILALYCFFADHSRLGLYLTIIGLIIAFGQIVRSEMKD